MRLATEDVDSGLKALPIFFFLHLLNLLLNYIAC